MIGYDELQRARQVVDEANDRYRETYGDDATLGAMMASALPANVDSMAAMNVATEMRSRLIKVMTSMIGHAWSQEMIEVFGTVLWFSGLVMGLTVEDPDAHVAPDAEVVTGTTDQLAALIQGLTMAGTMMKSTADRIGGMRGGKDLPVPVRDAYGKAMVAVAAAAESALDAAKGGAS